MNVELLLPRLEGVRKYGKGWVAKCPAHEDGRASLSICEGANGSILLHDFAGCEVADVLAAVGLTVSDLFPKRDLRDMTAAERADLRVTQRAVQWRAAMDQAVHEIGVVCAGLAESRKTRHVTRERSLRIQTAFDRLECARAQLGFEPHARRPA